MVISKEGRPNLFEDDVTEFSRFVDLAMSCKRLVNGGDCARLEQIIAKTGQNGLAEEKSSLL